MNQDERLKELFSANKEGVKNVYSSENYTVTPSTIRF